MISGEVAACCGKDGLDREGFMDWVMRVNIVEAIGNDVLDTGVETLEKGRVEFIDGNSMARKERGSDSQEAPIVFEDISFVTDTRLS